MFEEDIERVLISEEAIKARLKELGKEITNDYDGKEIVMVGLLNGAVNFFAALALEIRLSVYYDFMQVSSYGQAAVSSGKIKVKKDVVRDLKGCDVLIVEDLVDTGLTLSHVLNMLLEREPHSLKTCTLLDKSVCRKTPLEVDYCGFTVPDEFLVGYGLDYAQKYRNLAYIGILKKSIYS